MHIFVWEHIKFPKLYLTLTRSWHKGCAFFLLEEGEESRNESECVQRFPLPSRTIFNRLT